MPKSKLLGEIGQRLRGYRESMKLTVREFARVHALNASSCSSLENRNKTLYTETIIDMCIKLNLSPSWLLLGVGPRNLHELGPFPARDLPQHDRIS